METAEKPDKMGTVPPKRLLLTMGLPMVLSMMLQAVYNIVDSAFVSNMADVGEQALTALTIAFPFQMLMVAIGIGTGVGVNALVSRCLGEGDNERASRAAGNAVFMAAIIYVVFLLFGLFGTKAYVSSQRPSALVGEMAIEYLQICCTLSMGIVFFSIFEKLLQACGHSVCSTVAQIAGAVANIILDPIMIYGLFGFPEMGVKGAALATVIGQILSLVISVLLYMKYAKNIRIHLRHLKPSWKIIKAIYSIGLPAIISQALMSVMTYGLNIVLVRISDAMVTAYGLYYKIQQFILFAAFGLRDAITPIVSYSYGMGSRTRIKEGIKYGILYTLIISAIGLAAIEILAVPLSRLFGLSGETLELCISAMRIISISFVFAGANVALQGIFQALDGGLESLIVSLCRQLVLLFPFVLLFAGIAKRTPALRWLVWTAFPICELLSLCAAFLLYRRIRKITDARLSEAE